MMMYSLNRGLSGAILIFATFNISACNPFTKPLSGYEEFNFGISLKKLKQEIVVELDEPSESGVWYIAPSGRTVLGIPFKLSFRMFDDKLTQINLHTEFERNKDYLESECTNLFDDLNKMIMEKYKRDGIISKRSASYKFSSKSGIYVRKFVLNTYSETPKCAISVGFVGE